MFLILINRFFTYVHSSLIWMYEDLNILIFWGLKNWRYEDTKTMGTSLWIQLYSHNNLTFCWQISTNKHFWGWFILGNGIEFLNSNLNRYLRKCLLFTSAEVRFQLIFTENCFTEMLVFVVIVYWNFSKFLVNLSGYICVENHKI